MPKCNCSTYPFRPQDPCYKICTGRALNYASPDELESIFRMPSNLVEKIRVINQEGRAKTLDDYKSELTKQEFAVLNEIFSNLGNNRAAILWLKENRNMRGPALALAGL